MTNVRCVLLVSLVLTLVAACASDTDTASGPPVEPTPDQPTPVESALAFLVEQLNGDGTDTAELSVQFSPDFLVAVPIEQLVDGLVEIRAASSEPWTVLNEDLGSTDGGAELRSGDVALNVTLAVEAEAPHRITGLLLVPPSEPVEAVDDLAGLIMELERVAPTVRLGIYAIDGTECRELYEHNTTDAMPIGSIFKLWILAELAAQIEAGTASWDEVLPVQDRHKASPDGEVYALPEGTELSLRRHAELMISISDNSATDHLLYRLGRERVEETMAELTADAARNMPMFGASELFVIKFAPEPPNSSDYRELDTAGRRALLDSLEDQTAPWIGEGQSFPVINGDDVAVSMPRDHDLEWFATPLDICRTHAHLALVAGRPGLEPVAEILQMNATAGMAFEDQGWADLRFKGGSEQGIVATAWWMQDAQGRTYAMVGGVENPDAPIDPVVAVELLHQAGRFVAELDN